MKNNRNRVLYLLSVIAIIVVFVVIYLSGDYLKQFGHNDELAYVPINNIYAKVTNEVINMKVGDTKLLQPNKQVDGKITWTSSDPGIAKVADDGTVTALKPGKITVTAKDKDGNVIGSYDIVVSEADKVSISMKVNEKKELKYPSPSDGNYTWTSSNPGIAKVDDNGVVTALKPGKVTVTVKDEDGGTVVIYNITVTQNKPKTDKVAIGMKVSETKTLKIPVNTVKPVSWSNANPNIVSIANDGTVEALKKGSAIVTLTDADGNVVAIYTINVTDDMVPVDTVSVAMEVGETKTLNEPTTTSGPITWSNADPSIVSVASDGTVTALKPGDATVTAKDSNGDVVAIYKITVTAKEPERVTVSMRIDEIKPLKDLITTSGTLVWESSDPSVLTVANDGTASALKNGTVTVTAKDSNGNVVAIYTITVNDRIVTPVNIGMNINETRDLDEPNVLAKPVSWTSSDPSIATVASDGTVHALKKGTVTVTAKDKNGNVAAIYNITVTDSDDDIYFAYEEGNNYVHLTNQFPISDAEGKALAGNDHEFSFQVRMNDLAVGVNYYITVEKLDGSDFNPDYIKVYLDREGAIVNNCYRSNGKIKTFTEFDKYNNKNDERILYEGTVTSAEATRGYVNYTFKMWISEDFQITNTNYNSQTFNARVNVYANKS